jgi:AbrB family looped-hinge helix DNA binding protein
VHGLSPALVESFSVSVKLPEPPAVTDIRDIRTGGLRPGLPSSIKYQKYYVSGGEMRINSKGQVTIPAELRKRHGIHEGDEVEVIEDGDTLRVVRAEQGGTRGQRLAARMRGRASTTMSTDELLALLRGD